MIAGQICALAPGYHIYVAWYTRYTQYTYMMRLCAQTACAPNCYLMGCDGAGKRRMEPASCLCFGDKQTCTDAMSMGSPLGTYKFTLVLIKVTMMLGKGLIIIITFAQQVVEKR